MPASSTKVGRRILWLAFSLASAAGLVGPPARGQVPQGYHRFPALHGDTVVFTSEGDLWRVAAGGGVAQRLTTHPGTEAHAAFSPDGLTLAFSAEYEGPREVYTMPLTGGLPTRRTFHGAASDPVGWTPDGRILARTTHLSGLPNPQLVSIDIGTGLSRPIPLAQAADGSYSPDGPTLFFTRLPWQGSSTKRYQGGTAQNLWRFSPREPEAVPMTPDFKGTSKNPMVWLDRVHFLSDRDGIMNLWSIGTDGSDPRQHTRHRDLDILGASLHNGRVAYQLGADLRLHHIGSSEDRLIPIVLASDFDQLRERWIQKPLDYLTAVQLSPKGDRIVLTARGQVFVAPVEQGRFVEVPRQTGVRYRNTRFLPDGLSLVALSDESGELEFWRLAADGLTPPVQITTNGTVFRFPPNPSPDGTWIAYSDKDLKLWIHHLERRETRLITESPVDILLDMAWSPDSQWLAFTDPATNGYGRISIYHPATSNLTAVTSDRVNSFSPAWSPDGAWLYFLSDREIRSMVDSPWGALQPDPFFTETTRLYQLALTPGLRSPFAPRNELTPESSEKPASVASTNPPPSHPPALVATPPPATNAIPASQSSVPSVAIDFRGLAGRLHEIPVPAGNFSGLQVTAKYLLWTSRDTSFEGKRHLKQLEITSKDPKAKTLAEDIRDFQLSGDGKKLLIRKATDFHVIAADASAPAKLEDKVKFEGWTFSIQPREEWRQIFTEAWRMLRDYFYDRGMHQVDWPAMHRKYLPLVDRVSDRGELSDVLSQMVGELSTLHIYVARGDHRKGPDHVHPASLGARLSHDPAGGGWRIDHIHRADPDYPSAVGPLARPDVDVREGDVILSINGRSTLSVPDPSLLLRGQNGRQVLLEVRARTDDKPRRVVVVPISQGRAADLRYDEWELTRREKVETLGEGRIGYVHLRAMGTENIAEWARNFYPVFQRPGLIIDVRHNRGGNIDSWILGKLLRKAWFYWQARAGIPTWNMQYAFRGHAVVLCDEFTASDGEAFSEGFRRLGLGKVIGTRTWGGEIWLSADTWLVDRGMATAAEYGVYGPEGTWLIEGHGVDPDIVVDNLPHATFNGADAQLDAAVKHLEELIARDPRPVPPPPRYPDKRLAPSP